MQQLWSAAELVEHWSLTPEELALVSGKADGGKLGFAVQLAFYKQHANFPDGEADVAPTVIAHIAGQIGIPSAMLDRYDWTGRTGRRHRQLVVRLCLRGLPLSSFSQADSLSANASSLLGLSGTLKDGSTTSPRKYLRMVFRDSPVLRAISRIDNWSRTAQRRITLSNSMLITPVTRAENSRGEVKTWVNSQWKFATKWVNSR